MGLKRNTKGELIEVSPRTPEREVFISEGLTKIYL